MKYIKFLTVLVIALVYQQSAFAGDVVFNFGYSLGGDKLGTVYYVGGSSDSLSAGQGVDMALGYEMQHGADKKFATQLLYGFIYGGAGTSDGGIEWRNNYLQLAEFYRISNTARVGLGVISATSPSAISYGVLAGYDMRYADSMGYVLIAEQKTPNMGLGGMMLGLKYTSIRYSATTFNGVDISSSGYKNSANSLSFYIGWHF